MADAVIALATPPRGRGTASAERQPNLLAATLLLGSCGACAFRSCSSSPVLAPASPCLDTSVARLDLPSQRELGLDILDGDPELLRESSGELHELQRVDDRPAQSEHGSREREL